jgi:hypothetical protein
MQTKTTSNTKVVSKNTGVLATIRLYNPTQWTYQTFVEVPAGQLAAPGLIDWRKVRLVCDGRDVSFSLREGRAHWRASLVPVTDPRAEDLVVFTINVPPGTWSQVDVVSGQRNEKSALTRADGQLVVSYPNLKVVINQLTAMLVQVKAFSAELLATPMSADGFQVEEGVIEHSEASALGFERLLTYSHQRVRLKKDLPISSFQAKLVSSFSDPALTELNFILEHAKAPAMALTYRVHTGGLVEILADERPWEGASPWLNYGVEYRLSLKCEGQPVPDFETQFPFFGFQDYDAVVKNTGTLHRTENLAVLEVGEESINGRRWHRRLYIAGQNQLTHIHDMFQVVDKGLVVDVIPASLRLDRGPIQVSYPDGCKTIAETLVQALGKAGIRAESVSGPGNRQVSAIILKRLERPEEAGLEGDGFAILPLQDGNGASIVSGTQFGLMHGTLKLAEQVLRNQGAVSVPLMASNPGSGLRAGGFGGGTHEVDFPYGNDAEWIKVFDDLVASGMNTMICMGMWGNWKMPVTYKYMPELRSDSPDAYDEISGAKFSEYESSREQALKLLNYLHERGVKVWLEIPVGAIPTTFAGKFPDAVLPGNPKVPLVLHPKYQQYLQAFFKELLETYPIEGFMMVRDDNGGMDTSEEFTKHVAVSHTKNPAWEQELLIYDMLRSTGFRGDIAIYPYRDLYEPQLESALPKDLFIVGHGSGFGPLSRSYKTLGLMPDTWLDNIYAGFRLPPTSRMKRLISDRGILWVGGAFRGTELPWESLGTFTWQPATTVNTLRSDWGSRAFGKKNGVPFLRFSDAYEQLWNLMNGPLLPYTWLEMTSPMKQQVEQESDAGLKLYQDRLADLLSTAGNADNKDWFVQAKLYGPFFEYCLRRLKLFDQLYEIVLPYKDALETSKPLPADIRHRVTSVYRELLETAVPYANAIKKVPGGMMRATEPSAHPYREWHQGGYGQALDKMLKLPEFGGTLNVSHQELKAGGPFTITIELQNNGICPWVPREGQKLELDPPAKLLGLPLSWDLNGEWVLPGDLRVVNLSGTAPEEPGTTKIGMKFWSPAGPLTFPFIDRELLLKWE